MDSRLLRGSNWPERRTVPRAVQQRYAPRPTAEPKPKPREIELSISLPRLRLPRPRIARWRALRKTYLFGGCILVAIAATACGIWFTRYHAATGVKAASSRHAPAATGITPGTPPYQTMLPGGKTAEALGGWYRVSPPDRNPVYAYADTIGTVSIDVSEQPLPEGFATDTAEQVAQLAQGFNANEKLQAGGTTMYIGTSSKGPQSVIFTKNQLLVLIKSDSRISNDQWAGYISSLR